MTMKKSAALIEKELSAKLDKTARIRPNPGYSDCLLRFMEQ